MNIKEIESKVCDLIQEHLALDQNPKKSDNLFDDLGADSLDALEFIMSCETEFNVLIPDEEAEGIKTVKDVIDIVNRKLNEE